jgi:hypothetical protein
MVQYHDIRLTWLKNHVPACCGKIQRFHVSTPLLQLRWITEQQIGFLGLTMQWALNSWFATLQPFSMTKA